MLFASVILMTSFLKPFSSKYLRDNVMMKVEQENNTITVSVKTAKDNKIEFYMFTVEGNLIKELSISGTKKITIVPLEKGM